MARKTKHEELLEVASWLGSQPGMAFDPSGFGRGLVTLDAMPDGLAPNAADEEDHSLVATVSSITTDRMGDVVEPGGVSIEAFRKNPVVLFSHNYHEPAIARSLWEQVTDRGIVARPRFHLKTQLSRELWPLYRDGDMRAWSIGFIPTEFERIQKGDDEDDGPSQEGYHITGWELLEYSAVAVGANPDAVTNMLTDGRISAPVLVKALAPYVAEKVADAQAQTEAVDEPDEERAVEDLGELDPDPDEGKGVHQLRIPQPAIDFARALAGYGIECLECGEDFPRGSKTCPHCGDEIKTERELLDEAAAEVEDEIDAEVEKAGRVLSAKNRKLLTDASTAMTAAITAVDKLLEDADADKREAETSELARLFEHYEQRLRHMALLVDEQNEQRASAEDEPEPVAKPTGEAEPEGKTTVVSEITVADMAKRLGRIEDGVIRRLKGKLD